MGCGVVELAKLLVVKSMLIVSGLGFRIGAFVLPGLIAPVLAVSLNLSIERDSWLVTQQGSRVGA